MNILLFIRDSSNHNSLNYFTEEIAQQLKKHGDNIYYLSLTDSDKIAEDLVKILTSHNIEAAIMFNAFGQQDYLCNGDKNLWDVFDIQFFNYIVDHPIEHDIDLDSKCKNYHVICIDKKHKSFIENNYPGIKSVHFLPIAGSGDLSIPKDDYSMFNSRKQGIVLTAGLMDPDFILEQVNAFPQDIRRLALSIIEYMKDHLDKSPEEALDDVLISQYSGAIKENREYYLQIIHIMSFAPFYIRTWIRKKIVDSLIKSGVKLHIYGDGWDSLIAKYPNNNAVLYGDIDISQTPALYRDTQLALNIMPMFKAGSHDRIATAQINGAAVITDENGYLCDFYEGTDGIFYYSLNDIDTLPEKLSAILSDERMLYETAINGQNIARQMLNWNELCEKLYEILRSQIR